METDPTSIYQLGGTVVVVGLFLWYLRDRNGKHEKAMKDVSNTLREVNVSQQAHSRILTRIASGEVSKQDIDDLIKGV